jgi:hypothetical protein
MALSARAWTLPDEILVSCIHPGLNELIEFARAAGMPMIGSVDPYDDTRFNQMQMRLVIPELRRFTEVAPDHAADAARELLPIAELVSAKAHRYLDFIGD